MKTNPRKTNQRWYFYREIAGYIKLENGEFLYQPMFFTYDEGLRTYKLDWNAIDNDEHRAWFRQMEAELARKE